MFWPFTDVGGVSDVSSEALAKEEPRLGARPPSVAIVRPPIRAEKEKDYEIEKDWILAESLEAGFGGPALH